VTNHQGDYWADIVVVGAGIVGLATAWQILASRPGQRVVVVEKEPDVGQHQSSHNSGVLHAGIYYPPGSLKARLCGRGKKILEQYALERDIPFEHNGKLIVATHTEELGRLHALAERAAANDVPGVRLLDSDELNDFEPAVTGVAALHSPATGVIDFLGVCRALAADVRASGGDVLTGWPVAHLTQNQAGVVAEGNAGIIQARAAIVCAGVHGDRLAKVRRDVRIVPFRGSWYRLSGEVAAAIRGNIYPVPDPRFPFLGVHATRRIDGEVWAGPNAFLTLAREGRRRTSITPRDARDSLFYGGLWRFAGKHVKAAGTELTHELSRRIYARAVARYIPGVEASDLQRGPSGIRAQAMRRDGTLVDDFVINDDGKVVHVISAPSPAATASFAIGELLADRILAQLE
jgi:L-2-hydroxyglutarate oxidase LhgO